MKPEKAGVDPASASERILEGFRLDELAITLAGVKRLEAPSFRIRSGERVLLTGPSGSGKSIFFRCFLGLLPARSVAGSFYLDSEDPSAVSLSYQEFRRRLPQATIRCVFQDAAGSLHPYRTIGRQCAADGESFAQFHLDASFFRSRLPEEMSGGECQRVALLMAHSSECGKWLIADEPLTDIDHIARKRIQRQLLWAVEHSGKGLLLATHDPYWLPPGFRHYHVEQDQSGNTLTARLTELASSDERHYENHSRDWGRVPVPDGGSREPALTISLGEDYRYPGAERGEKRGPALQAFDLTLMRGEALGLMGESGSGKSTLLRLIVGLLPAHRGLSDLTFDLHSSAARLSLQKLPRASRYRYVQMVQQTSRKSLLLRQTIRQDLCWLARRNGKDYADEEARAAGWARRLNLELNPSMRLEHLSMGMLRRYTLIRSLLLLDLGAEDEKVNTPRILLLDEVSRGLGSRDSDHLVALLDEIRTRGVSLLVVSHDLWFLRRLCSRSRLMHRGRLLDLDITSEELEVGAGAKGETGASPNPYYRQFIDQKEVDPHSLPTD